MRRIVLRPGREGPVRAGHPWIFSGAIASGLEGAEPGDPVVVHTAAGRFVAAGYCNPRTSIAVRVLTLEDEPVDAALVGRRLRDALALRYRQRGYRAAGSQRYPHREVPIDELPARASSVALRRAEDETCGGADHEARAE